jgi:DNA invertase Pin-like site-specific DNA recombinase
MSAKPNQNIGYIRAISRGDALRQREALSTAGCSTVYQDHGSRAKALDRPGLNRALSALNTGDELIVCRLDCVGWSLGFLARLVTDLTRRGVDFKSLQENVDTGSQDGPFFIHIMQALVEFERVIWTEHTRTGLDVAEKKGRRPGRRLSMNADALRRARMLLEQGKTQNEVAAAIGISRATLNRRVGPTRRFRPPK